MFRFVQLSIKFSIAAMIWLAAVAGRAEDFPDLGKLPAIKELPDPLVMLDGTRITTRDEWNAKRKPQLKALFQHYMYGYLPAPPPIMASVRSVDPKCFGGKATLKQVKIAFGPPECPSIELLLVTPNRRSDDRPPAVFLGLNFTGNHTVLADPQIALAAGWLSAGPGVENERATEAGRGLAADKWEIEHTIDRGYAVATFYYGDVMPDKPDFSQGVHPFFGKSSPGERGAIDWGAIATWAWGLHRAVDYLASDKDVDAGRIIVFGHSRNGKAALLAAAFDERVAAVIPHQAGCGGTAPSRRHNPKGESVTAINDRFPHWFDKTFPKFNGQEEKLPFDQHCLVALCFPRPVLLSNGQQDQWADPAGQLDVLRGANRVYRQFGVEGIGDDETAEDGKLIGKNLCYYIRQGPHTVDKAYWDVFMDFADKHVAMR